MFAKMTIAKKLMGGFAALLVCVLALSYSSLSSIIGLRDDLDVSVNKTARKLLLIGNINQSIAAMRADARGMVLGAALKSQQDVALMNSNFEKDAASVSGSIKEVEPLLVTEQGKKLTAQLQSGLTTWKEAFA